MRGKIIVCFQWCLFLSHSNFKMSRAASILCRACGGGGSRNVRTAQDPLSHYFRLLANFFLDNLRVLYFIQAAPLHEQSGATFWGMASILPTMETPLDLGKTKVASCQGRVESTGEKLPRGILDTRYTCGNAVAVPVMSIIHVDCISHLRYWNVPPPFSR